MIRAPMIRAPMIRASIPIACLLVAVFALSPAAVAGPDPESPPPIDWRDFVDDMDQGDHVVGEELCAVPGTVAFVPDSFVVT